MQTREEPPPLEWGGVVRLHLPDVGIIREIREEDPRCFVFGENDIFLIEEDSLTRPIPSNRAYNIAKNPVRFVEGCGGAERSPRSLFWTGRRQATAGFPYRRGGWGVFKHPPRSRMTNGFWAGALYEGLFNHHSLTTSGVLPLALMRDRAPVPQVSRPAVTKTDRVDGRSAQQLLEQKLLSKTASGIRWDAEHQYGCRLRRRSKWLNSVNSTGLSSAHVKAIIRGRWSPDLTKDDDPLTSSFDKLLHGGAKFLGVGTAQTKPLSKAELKDGVEVVATTFIRLVHPDHGVISVFPELVARLGLLTLFRKRDDSLVLMLRLRALEWAKSRRIVDVDAMASVPFSIALACSLLSPERAATKALDDLGGADQRAEAAPWRKRFGDWIGGGSATLVSGGPFGKSWWVKGSG